ncbi:MAG: GNAT family N-acetyltransferase, partial [Nitrosopumilus sp. B06]
MDHITVRELQRVDLQNGFLATLDILKPASGIDPARAEEIFEKMDANPDYMVIVAESGGKIVGAVTLFIEQKFIHRGGRVGHVEDLAVTQEFQSHKVGSMLMTYLLDAAHKKGCYETILNCP